MIRKLCRAVYTRSRAFVTDQSGAAIIEYSVLVALIAAIAIAVVVIVGNQATSGFDDVSQSLTSAGFTGS